MKFFAALSLSICLAAVVIALPAVDPGSTITSPNTAAPIDDDIPGEEKASDIYRWTVICDDNRRGYCVNIHSTECDDFGFLHTDDTDYCGNGICWCVSYEVWPCTKSLLC
ncbi:hypothetical protein HD806DRAFT_402398 [Xylariaceae sp. AK1471]|nr:hypothetical protein HD806DRAFT_402398 [Xylariaceae sp. AK1471]